MLVPEGPGVFSILEFVSTDYERWMKRSEAWSALNSHLWDKKSRCIKYEWEKGIIAMTCDLSKLFPAEFVVSGDILNKRIF